MSNNSWRIGRIAGIEIRINPSWTLMRSSSRTACSCNSRSHTPRLSNGAGIVLAIAASILFLGSVLAHDARWLRRRRLTAA